MAEVQLTLDDINELFRIMPEAARQAQLIAQRRMIGELEAVVDGMRMNGHKEPDDAESREEAIPIHGKGKKAGKSRS